jgi:hypothetical protein
MAKKWMFLITIFLIIISQRLFAEDLNEINNNDTKLGWTVHFWYGPSISFGFFYYISFQYGFGSLFSIVENLPPFSDKYEKNISIANYIMYEYKNGYSNIRFNINLSINPPIGFLGCSLLMKNYENNIIWGCSPEIGLRIPALRIPVLPDIYYRYNIYQNNTLNCHEFGIRLSLFLFIVTNDK